MQVERRMDEHSFNGAMPFQAWIQLTGQIPFFLGYLLQWGHALSGMDTALYQACTWPRYLLQWGHALSGMDTISHYEYSPDGQKLQWGHALSGMDTTVSWSFAFIYPPCFNGAMPFQAWIL